MSIIDGHNIVFDSNTVSLDEFFAVLRQLHVLGAWKGTAERLDIESDRQNVLHQVDYRKRHAEQQERWSKLT